MHQADTSIGFEPRLAAPQAMDRSAYLLRPRPVSAPRARVFAFPFAGAGAVAYHGWARLFADDIDFVALQYPGRGRLANQAPCRTIEALAEECARTLDTLTAAPFYFFGHSMGATVAFELAHHLSRRGRTGPSALIVSARGAPEPPRPNSFSSAHLSDEAFCEYIVRYGGMRPEILNSPEMLAFVLPTLRADMNALDQWRYSATTPLSCPIIALGGDADASVAADRLSEWSRQTTNRFARHVFAGGHFYLQDHLPAVTAIIDQVIRSS